MVHFHCCPGCAVDNFALSILLKVCRVNYNSASHSNSDTGSYIRTLAMYIVSSTSWVWCVYIVPSYSLSPAFVGTSPPPDTGAALGAGATAAIVIVILLIAVLVVAMVVAGVIWWRRQSSEWSYPRLFYHADDI